MSFDEAVGVLVTAGVKVPQTPCHDGFEAFTDALAAAARQGVRLNQEFAAALIGVIDQYQMRPSQEWFKREMRAQVNELAVAGSRAG